LLVHHTSVSLEEAFAVGRKTMAKQRRQTLSELMAEIDSGRQYGNLSSAIRLYVLDRYRNQVIASLAAASRCRRRAI
jgi:predicted DNA-binding ribbon-helix-helix protein